jgi:hypothetical protein
VAIELFQGVMRQHLRALVLLPHDNLCALLCALIKIDDVLIHHANAA